MTADASRPRLVLIDGYSNIFRAFYAIRELSNSKGEPTNAVFGFVQMLRKLLRDDPPEYLGVAFDVSGPTVRDERYEDYKANRAPMPEELRPQIPRIRQAIEAYRIPILELAGYEADDVLGTLARKAAAAGFEVLLVSADKDLMQLVDDSVRFAHTGRNKIYDPDLVEEDLGVPPHQVTEVMALKGDSVDNIPGVPGIGEKGAVLLISEFGSLEALLERSGEVKRKSYREGLQKHREQALLSKELVTIHTDLPIEFEPDALRLEPPDTEALCQLFRQMEFYSLLEELDSVSTSQETPAAEETTSVEVWRERTDPLRGELALSPVPAADPVGVVVTDGEGAPWFADLRRTELRPSVVASLKRWLEDREVTLVGHDLKEIVRLAAPLPAAGCRLLDVMLLSYVLRPEARGHDLETIALERLGRSAMSTKEAGWRSGQAPPVDDDGLLALAGERAVLPRVLAPSLLQELGDGDLAEVFWRIEVPLLPVLVGMEEAGVLLDCDFLQRMSRQLQSEIEGLERQIYELAGERFNLHSPQQLGVVLFEKLGYPVIKKTRKTKSYSTSAETLQQLAQQGYPLPEWLLRFRELTKLKSTYVDALPALVGTDGRIHTRFQQAVTATGRLSSVNPNLQNIPVRTELGQQIRRAFVAPEGKLLLVADYNQIELRVLAHIARDPVLTAAFLAGEDIHRSTAAAVFGVAPEQVSAEQRRAAKAINFGIIYGISAFGLARNLGIQPGEAELFIRSYLRRYDGVQRFIEETLAAAEAEGRVETLFGRVRRLPEIRSSNRNARENARRVAINTRIQGTAADLMKKAMIALHHRLRREWPEARLLLTVHDELVLEVASAEIESVAAAVVEEMSGIARLEVPLVVDVGHGPTWFEAKA